MIGLSTPLSAKTTVHSSLPILVLFLLITMQTAIVGAAVIRVPADQPTIRAGINAAENGDTVLVADGTYSGSDNTHLSFGGKAINVRSENGPDHCIIDLMGDEGRLFHFTDDEGRDSVLRGFTMRNGLALGAGAIYIQYASPTIEGNVIESNTSFEGVAGAIGCHYASPLIRDNIITNNVAETAGGGAIECYGDSTPMIIDNRITDNWALGPGGAILSTSGAAPVITGNTISGNYADDDGGGISLGGAGLVAHNTISGNQCLSWGGGIAVGGAGLPRIVGNTISGNTAQEWGGGGICCAWDSSAEISGNFIIGNTSSGYYGGGGLIVDSDARPIIHNNVIALNELDGYADSGAGISIRSSMVEISGCTIYGNTARVSGGGVYIEDNFDPLESSITNCIIWDNQAPLGPSIHLQWEAMVTVNYSDVEGGWPGTGNIDQWPILATGDAGEYCLEQFACGSGGDSPCLDAGDPATDPYGTTNCLFDSGIVDMGFHYPMNWLATGPGPATDNSPLVRVFPVEQYAGPYFEFPAYGVSRYGVNVSSGDVTGDGIDEILTGPGPGDLFGPQVRGFSVSGTPLAGLNFLAYGTNRYGVNVATGDLDGNGDDEIITGAGPGAGFGPHVRAFDYDDGLVTAVPGVSYFAYGTLRWGVNVTAGDIDGDGYDEIVTGAGPGTVFGAHVRGWDVDGGTVAPISAVSYFAYATRRYGVRVSCGDLDGDGIDEIATAPGPSALFGAHIRGWNWDGAVLEPLPGLSFFAWSPAHSMYGAFIHAGTDLDGDGRSELVAGQGPDPNPGTIVKVFRYDGSAVTGDDLWCTLTPYPEGLTHGATVTGGEGYLK